MWGLLHSQADGFVRRMSRTHIHFATAAAHLRKNSWVAVALLLDLHAALAAGHTFFRAANGVLLTEGPLPVGYVSEVSPQDIDWDTGNAQQDAT
jgi:2'-phosphotransferase